MSPTTHIFAVGIEHYQDPLVTQVTFAENDVTEFVKSWSEIGSVRIERLKSSQATKTTLESKLKTFIANVSVGERIIFFYAGHGTAFNGSAYLTAYDTQLSNAPPTCIPLETILEALRSNKSNQVTLFIDACHGELKITKGMRSTYSAISDSELQAFCKDSTHHVAFVSCGINESSYPITKLKHGAWTYSVIQALRGSAKNAFERKGLVSGRSLQHYLSSEMPINLRVAYADKINQTPCVFGNATKECIVADLSAVLDRREAALSSQGGLLKEALLVNEQCGQISQLSGFKRKSHTEPTYYTRASILFVEKVGEPDVAELCEEMYQSIRKHFDYKFKQLPQAKDAASASIKSPDFDVDITLAQSEEDFSEYYISTTVRILEPNIISDDRFLQVFSKYCDTVVFELSSDLDLVEVIDQIENVEELRESLNHDADLTYLDFSLSDVTIDVRVEQHRICFSTPKRSKLSQLLKSTIAGVQSLNASKIQLNLTGSNE